MRPRALAGLGGAALLAALSVGCSGAPDTPGNAVIAYAHDYDSGDFAAAHDRLCESLQADVTVEDLERGAVDDLVPVNPLDSMQIVGEETVAAVRSSTQVVSGTVGGEEQTWEVGLVQEDGWRLCTFSRIG